MENDLINCFDSSKTPFKIEIGQKFSTWKRKSDFIYLEVRESLDLVNYKNILFFMSIESLYDHKI
ncbi:hypothetical protein CN692_05825 [Bacillus sp. AFS002410]|nr:hypothetical protein CN692_05825 [Bacillus sp. AFS002410]